LPVAGITAAGPTSFCEGGNVVLTASAGNSWLWSNGATTQSITAGISGNYSVTVTNASGCSATSSPTVVTLNPNPQVSITASPYTKLFPGLTTILTANVMVPGTYLYTWFKDGIVINGAVTTALTLTGSDNPGSYTMTVTNTVGPHCSKTSSALLISDSATTKLFIYPSPNTGRFRVVYYTPGINAVNQILVYDSGGELVYDHSYMINSPYESMDVDIQQHAGGIYHVVLFDGLGKKIAAGSVTVQ
jgi:hypothetical protein